MSAPVTLSPADAKRRLRERFLAYRMGLSEEDYRERSKAIVSRLAAQPEIRRARTLHVYWPLVARREIDLRPFIERMRARDKQIVLPVVVSRGGPTLVHRRYAGPASLRPNRWGIHEPFDTETVPPETLEVVIVPALGAGRDGSRLGYGGGFYDAFLRTLSVPTLCPVFAATLVDRLPQEPHDVPVTAVVTEDERITPGVVTSPRPPA